MSNAAPAQGLGVGFFASASDGLPQTAQEAAAALGTACGRGGYSLVYGGSQRGLMGIAARAAMAAGGTVIGVMPVQLEKREMVDLAVTVLHRVGGLGERKDKMAELSDAFVVLPGGFGTLDEAVEMITLYDIGIHRKPVLFCNVDGFWDPLMALIRHFREYGVLRGDVERCIRLCPTVDDVMGELAGLRQDAA